MWIVWFFVYAQHIFVNLCYASEILFTFDVNSSKPCVFGFYNFITYFKRGEARKSQIVPDLFSIKVFSSFLARKQNSVFAILLLYCVMMRMEGVFSPKLKNTIRHKKCWRKPLK